MPRDGTLTTEGGDSYVVAAQGEDRFPLCISVRILPRRVKDL
jgi:hypothetical protein